MRKELNEDVLILVDLETTGLNPMNGVILEVGAVIADAKTLNVIDQRSWVVKPMKKEEPLPLPKPLGGGPRWSHVSVDEAKLMADSFVIKMHTENGLWNEVEASEQTLVDVGHEFPGWLGVNGLDSVNEVFTIVGRGPDRFDRPWLRYNMLPLHDMDALFHYRSLDVSNVYQAFRKAGYDLDAIRPKKEPVHRAVADCLDTLEDWRLVRSVIGRLNGDMV